MISLRVNDVNIYIEEGEGGGIRFGGDGFRERSNRDGISFGYLVSINNGILVFVCKVIVLMLSFGVDGFINRV